MMGDGKKVLFSNFFSNLWLTMTIDDEEEELGRRGRRSWSARTKNAMATRVMSSGIRGRVIMMERSFSLPSMLRRSSWQKLVQRQHLQGHCRVVVASGATTRRSLSASAAHSQGEMRKVALVQGASRGLGLQFVTSLLERQDDSRVLATCRTPESAQGLRDLQIKYGSDRIQVVPLDLTKPETIEEAAKRVKETFSAKIDLLINVSGILHIPGKMMPETSLARMNYDQMMLSYQTHAIGPALVCKAFWPFLKQSSKESPELLPVIVNISAKVGSISDNGLGGWYSYRSSKSALNQLTKTMAVEFSRKKPKVAAIALHPGTNDTDLSKPFQKNYPKDKIFSKEFGVEKMMQVIDSVEEEDNGKFYAWDGQEIPW